MPLINEKQIATILDIDKTGDLFRRLVDIYETDISAHIDDLERALIRSELDTIKKISHSIKSSSLNIGASEMSRIAERLEGIAQMGDDQIEEFERLRECFQNSVAELKNRL